MYCVFARKAEVRELAIAVSRNSTREAARLQPIALGRIAHASGDPDRCAVRVLGCDGYGRSYDGYVPLHKLTSNFLYVGGWLVPLGPPGGGFKHMCPPQFSPTPLGLPLGTARLGIFLYDTK